MLFHKSVDWLRPLSYIEESCLSILISTIKNFPDVVAKHFLVQVNLVLKALMKMQTK